MMIPEMSPRTSGSRLERSSAMPSFVKPMLAMLSTMPTDESVWSFEVKWDGVRAIARIDSEGLQLRTRNGNEVSEAYPELGALAETPGAHTALLDGEIVAFDDDGRQSFGALQPRIHRREGSRRRVELKPVTYMIFDLLWLDGRSLMPLPYKERRNLLESLQLEGPAWRVPNNYVGEGTALFEATREQHLEGIVAKRLDSFYTPGRRRDWLKVKHGQRQEFVIGGYTAGKGGRAGHLGALELGVYDGPELVYAGRVGTGFKNAELAMLSERLGSLARDDSPFAGRQPDRGANFVDPQLVCEVKFMEWTKDGSLRHPSYLGLREDKDATGSSGRQPRRAQALGHPVSDRRGRDSAPRR
jgi:bifunctional non-homologous end joining protein LigD